MMTDSDQSDFRSYFNNNKKDKFHSQGSRSSSYKWVSNIRLLPSSPHNKDHLKTEYIEVNLNNSRKLINNLDELTKSTSKLVGNTTEINENLLQLQSLKNKLEWLDDL